MEAGKNEPKYKHATSFEQMYGHFCLYRFEMKFHLQHAVRSTQQPERIYATCFSVVLEFWNFKNNELKWLV